MKSTVKRVKVKLRYLAGLVAYYWLVCPMQSYALSTSSIVTGTTKLLNDAMSVILIADPLIAGVVCVAFLSKMQMCEDEEKPKYKKRVKSTLIVAVIIELIPALVKLLLSYYTSTQ